MLTKLQLVNRALSELGRLQVTSLSDSDDALYLSAKIDELLPELLQATSWDWAIIYKEDNTPLSTSFSRDYTYSYQLPGDFGQFFKFGAGAQWPSYAFVNGMLLAQIRPIHYYYISNQPSYAMMSPLFARALVLYTAAKSAPTLTNNLQLVAYLENEYTKVLSKAIIQNDMQRSIVSTPFNDFNRLQYV